MINKELIFKEVFAFCRKQILWESPLVSSKVYVAVRITLKDTVTGVSLCKFNILQQGDKSAQQYRVV